MLRAADGGALKELGAGRPMALAGASTGETGLASGTKAVVLPGWGNLEKRGMPRGLVAVESMPVTSGRGR